VRIGMATCFWLIRKVDMRIPIQGDYIKTVSDRFKTEWRGRIRRQSDTGMYLIAWSYCGSLPTDICTWVFESDFKIVRRIRDRSELEQSIIIT